MSIWKYADRISPIDAASRITLGEGQTPLVRSRKIGPQAGLPNLYFKLEGTNPTGSFKDRFAAAAVSHMLQTGKSECIATSSGNTGAALAAYSAAAGIQCRIAIAESAPVGKLSQMLAYGADIYRVRGFGLDPEIDRRAFRFLKRLSRQPGRALQVSAYVFSPEGMSGVETLGLELAEQLEGLQHVFCPAGGGGMCVGVARGFATRDRHDPLDQCPAVHCVQPEGNDTIATRLRGGFGRATDVESASKISGLQVSRVVDGHLAIEACRFTGGTGYTVTDDHIWNVQKRLAREEGIFTEPAGAVALAGALNAAASGELPRDALTACIVSGIGFKDTVAVDRINNDIECPVIDLATLESEVA
ncbi:MAG: pyridoxal-phosphate dependent enzyme [Fuerstiella sp.]|nr:pyridoxal-phosphate dependent enzyme [Fuerstiella sp.]